MEKISNDVFRKFIVLSILHSAVGEVECDEGTFIYLVSKKLEIMRNAENPLYQNLYNGVVLTSFLDTFKILNAKNRESIMTPDEQRIYDLTTKITSFAELEETLDLDAFLIEELLKYSLEFFRYNDLRKITLIKKLTEVQRYALKVNFPLFENDLNEYEYRDGFPLQVITSYYKNEMDKYEESEGVIDVVEYEEDIIEEIEGFIKMLAGEDPRSYEQVMQEIILTDYKWGKYLIDNKLQVDAVDMESQIERVETFEEYSLEDLLRDEVLYDDYYLKSLVNSILQIKYDNLFIDPKIINDEKVEEHYQKIMKKKIKKQ